MPSDEAEAAPAADAMPSDEAEAAPAAEAMPSEEAATAPAAGAKPATNTTKPSSNDSRNKAVKKAPRAIKR